MALAETLWVLDAVYERTPARLAAAVEFSDCLVLEIARKAGYMPFGMFDRGRAKLDGAKQLQVPAAPAQRR